MMLAVLWIGMSQTVSAGEASIRTAAGKDVKMVVLSDLHVMAPELLVNGGSAWDDFLANDRKMVDKSQALFDEMVSRLKTDLKPELVLITGDLTKDGELLSHQYVVSKLDELKAVGIQTLVIPGNHDFGTRNTKFYDGDNTSDAEAATAETFATLYARYGYGEGSEREATTLTYACEPVEGLVVIGIDSGAEGSLSAETLDWVCQKASSAKAAGKQVVALMHHALIPHVTNAEVFVHSYVISDFDQVRLRLMEAGVKVIFTGHFHITDIAKDFNDDLTETIFDVATGALSSYPCDYREVTLAADHTKLKITTGHISSLPGEDDFAAYSKERLRQSVKKIVENIATDKGYGALLFMFGQQVLDIADAYIIHAEGNEAEVNTDAIYKSISVLLKMFDGGDALFQSMLKDLAPYGKEGRENCTNDLTLSIELGQASEAPKKGDANGDNTINAADIVFLVNIIMGSNPDAGNSAADVNGDGVVNAADIVEIVKMIMAAD